MPDHTASNRMKLRERALMDLSNIADIADLVAAFAIVVSLGFVGFELRMSRKQSELSNWREILQTFVDYKGATNDLEFSAFLVRAHRDFEALDDAEKQSFGLFLEQGIHIMGNFLKHNDSLPSKLLGLDDAIATSCQDLLTTPGGAAWWAQAQNKHRFMPETYIIVNALLERAKNRER